MDEVSVEWLRRATEVLLRHLEETQGPRIKLEQDYFWSIDAAHRYDVTTEPNIFTVGSLTDGAEFVQSMVQNGAVLNHGLVWLGELFQAVGEQSAE
jgi:hypothetical protein